MQDLTDLIDNGKTTCPVCTGPADVIGTDEQFDTFLCQVCGAEFNKKSKGVGDE